MGRIILDFPDDMDPIDAMSFVIQVLGGGLVSKSRGREQYCFLTTFKTYKGRFAVYARPRRSDKATDSFQIRRIEDV